MIQFNRKLHEERGGKVNSPSESRLGREGAEPAELINI